jgi:hypothetical protein
MLLKIANHRRSLVVDLCIVENLTALQPIPVDQLETLLERRAEAQARPRATPRDVLAVWMGNAGAGLGAAMLVGVGCSVFGVALWPTGASAAGAVGGVVFGVAMLWRGIEDEATARLSNKRVRRAVADIESAAKRRVELKDRQLGAAFDTIEQLERQLDRVERQRDAALMGERQTRQASANPKFVAPSAIKPPELEDAEYMITHWFETGSPLSCKRAQAEHKWTQDEWQAAYNLLKYAGVVYTNKTQPARNFDSLDESLDALHTHMMVQRVKEVPPTMPRQSSAWADDDDDIEG